MFRELGPILSKYQIAVVVARFLVCPTRDILPEFETFEARPPRPLSFATAHEQRALDKRRVTRTATSMVQEHPLLV
jgi:hypothetical protein